MYGEEKRPPQAGAGPSRESFEGTEVLLSSAAVLKVLAVPGCVAASALWVVGRASCSAVSGLGAGGAAAAAAGAATAALLYAGLAMKLPSFAPRVFLYTDIVLSTTMGAVMIVSAVLSAVFCEHSSLLHYLRGLLTVVNSFLLLGSAGGVYRAATARWDASAASPRVSRVAGEQDA